MFFDYRDMRELALHYACPTEELPIGLVSPPALARVLARALALALPLHLALVTSTSHLTTTPPPRSSGLSGSKSTCGSCRRALRGGT